MELFLGDNNTITEYLLVLLVYGLMFLLIRSAKPTLELNFRGNYFFLVGLWAFMMLTGNYLFYRLGVMSFLPWFNNIVHSIIWVGFCLGWLYYTIYHRPLWEQFILFAFTSFIVKMAEYLLLGSWFMNSYLGIDHHLAYLVAMSIVDGFYPIISLWVLKLLARRNLFGVYRAELG